MQAAKVRAALRNYDPDGKNHRHMLCHLALALEWKRGAELGVARGLLFGKLLASCPDLHLIGVDLFRKPHNRPKVMGIVDRFTDRCTIYGMSTNRAARFVPNGSLDFVFIDAGHGYEAARSDIRNWAPKVRQGGFVLGHDFDEAKHPGVVRAVDEAFDGYHVLLPHTVWMRQ